MSDDRASRRIVRRAAARLLIAAGVLIAASAVATVHAQFAAPPPVIPPPPIVNNVVPPTPGVGIDPGRIVTGPNVLPRVEREFDQLRHTPRVPRRDTSRCNNVNGKCASLWVVDDWRGELKIKRSRLQGQTKEARRDPPRVDRGTLADRNYVPNQVVAEIDGALSVAQTDALARRHRLVRLDSQSFPLIGSTVGLFQIGDRRSPQTVIRALGADVRVRSAQLNFRYRLQDDRPAPGSAAPLQYALAKLRLPDAHALSRGQNVTVAVIDSAIDAGHPELDGAVAGSFDALGSKEGPHLHGTGIAGIIVSRARLTGSAPAAKVLAIRAFGVTRGRGESTSYVILKAIDYAASHGSRIVNMSFAGPNDPLIARGIAALAARDVVMVAASGNEGAKSLPLYPAANPNVIAVGATDATDQLFPPSNRGNYIAVTAPGAEIFLAAPDGKYRTDSGTSFSAAFVSGVVALMLEREPGLKPLQVRTILMQTARDLGAPGRDDLFGAGEADAFAAVSALRGGQAPVAAPASTPAAQPSLAATPTPATSPATADASLAGPATPPAPAAAR